jgi:hypothetical protein
VFRRFFAGNSKRIVQWFAHFSMSGLTAFRYGAAALAQHALANRADVWHLLVWGGKHSQAPVAVAARPQYFCELEVVATVQKFLDDCPGFWSSPEFR